MENFIPLHKKNFMVHYLSACCLLICFISCNNVSEQTKKQIKQTGKEIAKQIEAAIEHTDLVHDYISFEAKKDSCAISMYWKNDKGIILGSLQNLKSYVEKNGDSLLYACNGGMYMQNQAPLGYYIEDTMVLQKINTKTGTGNFYLKPKGVFYLDTDNLPVIQSIETKEDRDLLQTKKISFLTQSGPMLIHNNKINSLFTANSTNINVRNGAGILPNGNAYFAMSTYPVNFYDFAKHFKDKGCKEALYFDGFVSRSFCPQQNYMQLDGAFGVMIAVVKKK
jgi:uncharacterized protein YigE (DUF2233 family)